MMRAQQITFYPFNYTDLVDLPQPDVARAVTWMSEATGNKLDEILKFDYNYKWKDQEAQVQEMSSQTAERKGKFGSFVQNSTILRAVNAGANGLNAQQAQTIEKSGPNFDPLKDTYPNHVFGPYNSIRNMMISDYCAMRIKKSALINHKHTTHNH